MIDSAPLLYTVGIIGTALMLTLAICVVMQPVKVRQLKTQPVMLWQAVLDEKKAMDYLYGNSDKANYIIKKPI